LLVAFSPPRRSPPPPPPAARLVEARGRLHAELAEQIDGMADLIAFGADADARARDAAAAGTIAEAQQRRGRVLGGASAATTLLAGLTGFACLWLAIPQVRAGSVAGTFLAVVPLVIFATFEGVAGLGDAARQIEISRVAAVRTFSVTDVVPRVTDPPAPVPVPADPSIAFDGVSFRYAADAPLALDRLGFDVAPGARIGLVGASGAGKSTVVQLLLRFWDPTRGTISVVDRDHRGYTLEGLRAVYGVVPQHPFLFNGTLRDNLLLADGTADDAVIGAACERAQLGPFVASLPEGLDTLVGENGLRLSGGERQRVAIARVFLRDAPITILDEATANLDGQTERALLRELDDFVRDRTLVVVTHRPAPLALVDRVVRLDRPEPR
jgi:ATP-binding cassette, subfamily C, bacterial CydC